MMRFFSWLRECLTGKRDGEGKVAVYRSDGSDAELEVAKRRQQLLNQRVEEAMNTALKDAERAALSGLPVRVRPRT